ncbi:uncharacterized protein BKCO1_1900017 [Diplodia corticola]|uniref:Uncharacterized protein n=1 Tax=Diplodia corticola TaxID=236234 RepID=A0A1J9R141_9PEZI|nr:uncharacterized protein BKCO1_1900017 [Diplodia corticola]OJD35118.1 hypothetical protein BKCO1_1900017 [Diplodia corticola]
MFKPSAAVRPLRAFRHVAPVVHRQPLARYASTLNVPPVRIKRRFFTWKRLLAGTIYTGAAYTWALFVLTPVFDLLDEQEGEEGDEAEEDWDEEWDDDAMFIPLGWTKPVPRTFYRGSDPEWQEFRKVAVDQKRHERIRHKLVSLVRNHIAHHPAANRLGHVDVTKGRYWLDIVFPDGPPQEYERAGIEIADDYIAWTRRPVDQINYQRLKRALWPVAVASGALASTQYLWHVQMNKLRQWIGLSPKVDPAVDVLARHLEAMQRAKQEGSNRPFAPPNTSERTVASANPNANANAAGKTAAAEKHTNLPEFEPIPPQSIALSIFSSTLLKNWKRPQLEPPRGTILVTGLIEIRGDKARTVLDVTGAYDPLIDKYVALRVGSRLIQDKQQRPRGGR